MKSLYLPCLKSTASMLGNGRVVNPGYREVTGFFQACEEPGYHHYEAFWCTEQKNEAKG